MRAPPIYIAPASVLFQTSRVSCTLLAHTLLHVQNNKLGKKICKHKKKYKKITKQSEKKTATDKKRTKIQTIPTHKRSNMRTRSATDAHTPQDALHSVSFDSFVSSLSPLPQSPACFIEVPFVFFVWCSFVRLEKQQPASPPSLHCANSVLYQQQPVRADSALFRRICSLKSVLLPKHPASPSPSTPPSPSSRSWQATLF